MSLRLRVRPYMAAENPGVFQRAHTTLDKPLNLLSLHLPICQMMVISVCPLPNGQRIKPGSRNKTPWKGKYYYFLFISNHLLGCLCKESWVLLENTMGATLLGEMHLGQQERVGPSWGAVWQQEDKWEGSLGNTILLWLEPHTEDCHVETGTLNSFVMAEDQGKEQRSWFFWKANHPPWILYLSPVSPGLGKQTGKPLATWLDPALTATPSGNLSMW